MNIKIKKIEIEYPDKVVDDKFFIEYFKEQGKDISKLLTTFGKSKRRIMNDDSGSTLSLGIKAARKVLEKSNLTGKDIDVIIFTSQFPEYTCPSQALILHNAIKGKENDEVFVMDMNVNSAGMLRAFESASRYLLQKKSFNRALIVGADYLTVHCNEDDENSFPILGDCGCAVIIEKTEEQGFIDNISYTNSDNYDAIIYPQCGSSYLADNNIEDRDKKLLISRYNFNQIAEVVTKSIKEILKRNNLEMDDISAFCVSQGSIRNRYKIIEALDMNPEKYIHVSDKYGVTGVSSTFMALYEGVKIGKVKRGDYIILCSFTHGFTVDTVLTKY